MHQEKREQLDHPQEVTAWYVPHRVEGQEVVEMYVREENYPHRARPLPQKRRSRKGLWIFLAVLLVLAIAVGIGVALTLQDRDQEGVVPGDGSDASSIVDIFEEDAIAIPRADPDPAVQMALYDRTEVLTPQDVYGRVSDATVMVLAGQGERTSVGTGVIFTQDGYVVTNAHVLAGSDSASVLLYGSYLYETLLVGYDVDADLAVLKVIDGFGLPTVEFGNSDDCRVGDTVYAIGNPLGVELEGTFTDGMLSAINRSVTIDGRTMNTLQTTAALNSGNSGGPLINDCGQVIGINTLKMSTVHPGSSTATIEGLGFAIPSADVLFVVNAILAEGEYRGAPSFGMMVANVDMGDVTEVVIHSVDNGGGAFNAALEPGDVILAVDGEEIHSVKELQAIRRTHRVEDVVTVTYRRNGQTAEVEVTLYSNRW